MCTSPIGMGNCAMQKKNIVLWRPVNKCNYTCHRRRLNGLFFLKIKTVEVHSWGENKGSQKGLLISRERNDKS